MKNCLAAQLEQKTCATDPGLRDRARCSSLVPHPNELVDLGESILVNAVETKPEAVVVPDTTLKPGQLHQ